MDQRLLLGGAGVVGTALAAGLMLARTPDTGASLDQTPTTSPGAVAAPIAPAVASPDPAAPVKAKAAPEPEPLGWDQLIRGDLPKPKAPPKAWEPKIKRPQPGPGWAPPLPEDKPLPPDVRGVEVLFDRHEAAIQECVTWNAPKTLRGEDRVIIDVTLTPDETGSSIALLAARGDTEGRYGAFMPCLAAALAGARFGALKANEPVVLSWPVWRD